MGYQAMTHPQQTATEPPIPDGIPGDDAAEAHEGVGSSSTASDALEANGDVSHAGNMAADVLSFGPEAKKQQERQRQSDTMLQQEYQHESRENKAGELLCDARPVRPCFSSNSDLLPVLHRIKGEITHALQEAANASNSDL